MNEKKQKKNRKKTLLALHAPQAKSVFLAGDFNEWDTEKHRLKKSGAGAWETTLMLAPSTYEYKFLVDGKWEEDPANSRTCPNCFGTQNNLLTVSE